MAAKDDNKQTEGQIDPGVTDNADSEVARAAGLTEGDIKALRDDAHLNNLAGHEANVHTWAASAAGKEWAKGEKDRVKAEKEAEKKYDEQTDKNGLTEAEAAYFEAVDKAN